MRVYHLLTSCLTPGSARCSRRFHPRMIFAMERSVIASGSMIQGLLRRQHVCLLALPDLQGRLLNGASKRKHQRPWQLDLV